MAGVLQHAHAPFAVGKAYGERPDVAPYGAVLCVAAQQLTALPAETAAHCGLVPYRAVGTESGLLLYFRPDRVLEADGKTLDCVCAAGPPGFESGQYEGLICV